jgi:hypothetical protein
MPPDTAAPPQPPRTPPPPPLVVLEDGRIDTLWDDRLAPVLRALGRVSIRRASHVEPTPDGAWTADLGPSGGPVLGPFPLRRHALEAERDWLLRQLEQPPEAP